MHYLLGARLRNVKEIYEKVLSRGGRYREVHGPREKSNDPSPLKVKEVRVDDRRYVVCLNEEQAQKDRADREAIVEALREQLKHGDKSLVGNKGYRKYLHSEGPKFTIDEEKVKWEERFDGKWVLQTDLEEMTAEEVALQYKQLWMVEEMFRTVKTLLGDAADLPQVRRDDPRACVLQLSGVAAARNCRTDWRRRATNWNGRSYFATWRRCSTPRSKTRGSGFSCAATWRARPPPCSARPAWRSHRAYKTLRSRRHSKSHSHGRMVPRDNRVVATLYVEATYGNMLLKTGVQVSAGEVLSFALAPLTASLSRWDRGTDFTGACSCRGRFPCGCRRR